MKYQIEFSKEDIATTIRRQVEDKFNKFDQYVEKIEFNIDAGYEGHDHRDYRAPSVSVMVTLKEKE